MNLLIAYDITLIWLIIVNSLSAGLFYLAATRIPAGPVRLSFLGFLGATMLYANPTIFFWHPGIELEGKLFVSRLVFGGAMFYAVAAIVFIITLTESKREFFHWRFALFIANVAVMMIANAAGYVVTGVVPTDGSVRLEYGVMHQPFILSGVFYVAYFAFIGWRGYRRCQSEILQVQLKTLSIAGVFTWAAIVLTNGLLPIVTGSNWFSPLAALEILVFYSALLYIILNGETLVVIRSVRRLLKEPLFEQSGNRQALRMYIHHLHFILTKNPEEMHRRVSFQTADGGQEQFYVSKGARYESGPVTFHDGVPVEWYTGMQNNVSHLEQENLRLSIGLEAARNFIHDNQLTPPQAVADPLPFPEPLLEPPEDPVETLALELKDPGMTFTANQALDILHESELEQALESGRILPVNGQMLRIARPERYRRSGAHSAARRQLS